MIQMNRVDMRQVFTGLLVAALTGALASCSRNTAGQQTTADVPHSSTQFFSVTGLVKELKPDDKMVVIQHEEIPNYMQAMTMPFEVRDTNELAGLKPGDQVSFRMLVTEKDGWIDRLTKLGSTPVVEPPHDPFRRVRFVEPLQVGDRLPDYAFTNELGQVIHLADFQGQALAFTFIFTRCPFPNFCPRMSSNFADAYKKLSSAPDAPKNWRLLSISFDPEHDRPELLKSYAKRYRYETNHWSFATGALIDIDAITEQFGLMFPREGAGFNHNLRTVVVDARGKVQKVFTGNEWKVEELVAEIVKAATAK
jgi:protein SCO1/2